MPRPVPVTAPVRRPSASPILLVALLVAIVVALGTCGGGPLPGASATPTPPPGSGSAAPSATPAGSPSATPGGSVPSPSPATTLVRVYLLIASGEGNEGLVPVLREVPRDAGLASAAVEALLAGPNEAERAASPRILTAIPAGTRLLGVEIADGVATVDLSREYESGGGSAGVFARLAQVTWTLTQFPSIETVRFALEGVPVELFSAEGIILDGPVGRADWYEQLPAIFVDEPAWGGSLANPARVEGLADVFEAQFRVRLLDAERNVLADEPVMASCGTGCVGSFRVLLDYEVDEEGWGILRVYDTSERDGSAILVTEYPVRLVPAG